MKPFKNLSFKMLSDDSFVETRAEVTQLAKGYIFHAILICLIIKEPYLHKIDNRQLFLLSINHT